MDDKKNNEIEARTAKKLSEMANDCIGLYGFKHKVEEAQDKKNKEETYRTTIRRQRDKILYTGGFRRLQDKTQVMSATLTGDHRTRLTHTLEVEQIAVSVANAIGLNSDLVSAIALGHDIGHTPFGHAAERALNELLDKNGGFHHSIESVKYIWEKYGDNIISEVYEGILLHDSDVYTVNENDAKKQLNLKEDDFNKIKKYLNQVPVTLEAQTVIWADKIAYITHDIEDFLMSPIYKDLKNDNEIENELCCILRVLTGEEIYSLESFELRDLIRGINSNLITTSIKNIKYLNIESDNIENNMKMRENENNEEDKKKAYLDSLIINLDDKFRGEYYKLRKLLNDKYISSPYVQRSDAKAQKIVKSLFEQFTENYKLLPLEVQKKIDMQLIDKIKEQLKYNKYNNSKIDYHMRSNNINAMEKIMQDNNSFKEYKDIKQDIVERVVSSYIATMSDTYAQDIFCNFNASKDNYLI